MRYKPDFKRIELGAKDSTGRGIGSHGRNVPYVIEGSSLIVCPHIALLCNEYPPAPGGGIGTFYQTLGRALVNEGWDVTVLGYYLNTRVLTRSEDSGVVVWRLPASPKRRGRYQLNMILDRLRLGRLVRKVAAISAIDLIESADYQGLSWAMPKTIQIVVRLHGADVLFSPVTGRKLNSLKAHFEMQSLLGANHIVGTSEYVSQLAIELLGNQRTITTTIHNMVDVELFSPQKDVLRNTRTVGMVSTLTKKKGIFQLLEAWEQVHASCPDCALYYYGRDSPDEFGKSNQENLQTEIENKHMAGSVRIMGHVPYPELPQVFLKTGVLVFPSYVEAHPRAWLEAMASAAPVVGSSLGPGSEVIEDGRTGLLVDPRETGDMAAKIGYLINNPSVAKRLGEAAREDMVNRYSTAVLLKRNIEFYNACLSATNTQRMD